MNYACEWVRKNLGKETPSEPFPCEWVKQHWEDEVWEAPYPCEAIEQYAESLRTVLYEDGTFIINERGADAGVNVKKHGEASYVYPPLDSEHDYVFARQEERYWQTELGLIKSVKFGSPVQPTSMRAWFNSCVELESFDSTNLDTSECTNMQMLFKCESGADNTKLVSLDLSSWNTSKVTDMKQMFNRCQALTNLNVGFDTSSVTNISQMFGNCNSLTSLDLSTFDTSSVTDMSSMFTGCTNLQTIYASNLFDVTNVTDSLFMFRNCTSIVGGAGTTYDSDKVNKEYARIDNPPDAPGYFTQAV